ncbi:MAG: exodeoxyribonuclease I [Pseudoxanthomonas sp.]
MNTMLFFDYETTGLVPARERPTQFACVRTNMDLEFVGEPTTLYCKPAPDHLPDAGACLATGITPQLCNEVGLPELQFVREVYRGLGAPGTIGAGYNSIAFDDEVTRFMLWRNLRDPYEREWKNHCSRWDVMMAVRAAYALRPDTMEWPREEDGRVSFALERLSGANQLLHESAHDALSDVYATIALARLVMERQPRLYAHCLAMRHKNLAMQEMDLERRQPFIHVGRGAAATAGLRMMLPLAAHPTNRNEVIAWDLAHDPRELLDMDAETARKRLFTRVKDRPEGFQPLPLESIAANQSPAVFANLDVVSGQRATELGLDLDAAMGNAATMARVLQAMDVERLLQAVFARDSLDADAEVALYAGLLGITDRRTLDQLRILDPRDLCVARPEFDDPRLTTLWLRYKARHYPDALSPRELDKWEEYRFEKLITGTDGSRTVASVREDVVRYRRSLVASSDLVDPGHLQILADVLAHANGIAAQIDPYETVVPARPDAAPALATISPLPVQPDMFGGAGDDAMSPRRRAIARRA